MQLESRARRQQEFLVWFAARYKPASTPPIKEDQTLVMRVWQQQTLLSWYIIAYKPCCYWCEKVVADNSFYLAGDEKDSLLLHHVDEDRTHNENKNLELCHKDCHQQMHKLSTKLVLPAEFVREIMVAKRKETAHA